jgi:hypothetical protein
VAEWAAILEAIEAMTHKTGNTAGTTYYTSAPPPDLDVLQHTGQDTIPGWKDPPAVPTLGSPGIVGDSQLFHREEG